MLPPQAETMPVPKKGGLRKTRRRPELLVATSVFAAGVAMSTTPGAAGPFPTSRALRERAGAREMLASPSMHGPVPARVASVLSCRPHER
jgi:hypothetical protein